MNWTGDWTKDRTGTGQGHMARQDRNKATWPDRTGTKRKESRTVSGQTIILTKKVIISKINEEKIKY
jgi:hypothetical protein